MTSNFLAKKVMENNNVHDRIIDRIKKNKHIRWQITWLLPLPAFNPQNLSLLTRSNMINVMRTLINHQYSSMNASHRINSKFR